MSRVTITDIEPGADLLSPTKLNASLSSWNTASAQVDATNVRDEGLDRRNFAARVIAPAGSGTSVPACDPYANDVTISIGSPASTPTAVNDGSDIVAIGPIAYDSTDSHMLEVAASVELFADEDAAVQANVHLQLYYSTDWDGTVGGVGSATWTAVASSYGVYATGRPTAIPIRDVYTVVHQFDPNGTFGTTTTLYFALFYHQTDTGGSSSIAMTLADPSMWAKKYTR